MQTSADQRKIGDDGRGWICLVDQSKTRERTEGWIKRVKMERLGQRGGERERQRIVREKMVRDWDKDILEI